MRNAAHPHAVFPRLDRGTQYPLDKVPVHSRKPRKIRRLLDRPVKPGEGSSRKRVRLKSHTGYVATAMLAALLIWANTSTARAGDQTIPAGPFNAPALYPEGPVFIGGALYYAEMTGDRVVKWADAGPGTFFERKGCGPTSISAFGADRFAVTCHLDDAIAVVDADGVLVRLIETSDIGARLTSPNDSHADHAGGVYFSSSGPFNTRGQPSGRVFHLAPDGTATLVAKGLNYANGVFVTASGMVYVSEHLGKIIQRYRIGEGGALIPLGPFADIARLAPEIGAAPATVGPDGLEVTPGGTVFVAIYGSGKILQISAIGTLQRQFETGLTFVTSLALDLDRNRMIVTGAHSNTQRPFRGEVLEFQLGE